MTVAIKIPQKQWDLLNMYKIMWPSEFKVKIVGEVVTLADINLNPPPPTEQTKLMDIDKMIRSEYTEKRNPDMG